MSIENGIQTIRGREAQWEYFATRYDDFLLNPDKAGNTALHKAASKGLEHVVKDLVDGGYDINAKNVYGESVVREALAPLAYPGEDPRAIQQCLIDAGADLTVKTTADQSLLYTAALRNDPDMCAFLIDKAGLDVNDRSISGETALHAAAFSGAADAIDVLVERGADMSIKSDKTYKTPRQMASGKAAERLDEAVIQQRLKEAMKIRETIALPDPKAALARRREMSSARQDVSKGMRL